MGCCALELIGKHDRGVRFGLSICQGLFWNLKCNTEPHVYGCLIRMWRGSICKSKFVILYMIYAHTDIYLKYKVAVCKNVTWPLTHWEYFTWRKHQWNLYQIRSQLAGTTITLKIKSYQFDNFVITGGTINCHYNLQCNQWWQNWFSVE